METKTYPKSITVTITYNKPSKQAIKSYAKKLKNLIDCKMQS